jgi:hypothetical protein
MAIAVDCGACGHQFPVPAANAGRRAKCPGCGRPVAVPATRGAPAAAPPPAPAPPTAPPTFEQSVLARLERIAGAAEDVAAATDDLRRRVRVLYFLVVVPLVLGALWFALQVLAGGVLVWTAR